MSSTGPSPRFDHAMAFDPVRGRTVLFGGRSAAGRQGDTWEWNGTTWTLMATTGPTPREAHDMAYDPSRNRTVLFGGIDAAGHRNDTWEWNGTDWVPIAGPAPTARAGHRMAYDMSRSRIVLFGGIGPSPPELGDTWERSGTAWSQVSNTGPVRRSLHTMAYDPVRGRVVLHGGQNGQGTLPSADGWEWMGAAWQFVANGPGAGWAGQRAMAPDPFCSRLLMFGVAGDPTTWALGQNNTWVQAATTGPVRRSAPAMVYDLVRGRIVLFGGYGAHTLDPLGDTWEWNGTAGGGSQDDCEPWVHAPSQREPASAAYGGCTGPAGISLPDEPDPIYFACGEFYVNAEDMRIKGRGLDFVWARTYGSVTGFDTPQGQGWDHSYNISVSPAGPALVVSNGAGRKTEYTLTGLNTWTSPDSFRILTRDLFNGVLTLAFPDKSRWHFHPHNGAPAQGRISSIVDRNGNAITFAYDGQGRLATITDTLGRVVTVAYTPGGRVASVTDFTGRSVAYTYSAAGDLLTARSPLVTGTPHGNDFPAGKSTTYTYSSGFADERLNHNLLTIRDPRGNVVVTNTYHPAISPGNFNFDRLTRHVRGDAGDIIDIVYVPQTPGPMNNFATVKAIINDRVGNVREFSYDARRRGVIFDFFTGRADPDQPTTETTNRPANPLRAGDPPYFRTYAEYNSDSMVTRLIHPNLNETVCVYDTGNSDRRAQGNLLEHRRVAGPLGGDQSEISEFYEYAAGLGGCCGTSFVTRHVDPRGNETRHTFDANGNRLTTVHRIAAITESWTYNAFGQVTRHILPDNATGGGCRRVDTYSYYTSGPQNGYLRQTVMDATDPAACPGPHFNITTISEYDARGNAIRLIDPRGNDTLITYNQLDQPVRELSPPAGGGVRIERLLFYDANDNLVRTDVENRDENGVRSIANTHFSTVTDFEALNRPVRICSEVGTANLAGTVLTCAAIPFPVAEQFITEEWVYDGNRNVIVERGGEAAGGGGQTTNTVDRRYDERDLLFRETQALGAAGPGGQSTTQYDYDPNGNESRVTVGIEGTPRVSNMVYDGFDRALRVEEPMGNAVQVRYDPNGNVGGNRSENPPVPHTSALQVSGELVDFEGMKTQNVRLSDSGIVYDAMDRVVVEEERHFDPQTQANIGDGRSTLTTTYNHLSEPLTEVNDNGHAVSTTYDTAGRVRVVTDARGNTVTTTYDANFNVVTIVEMERSDLGGPNEQFTTTHVYDALNRRVATSDNAGNTRRTFYDSRNNEVMEEDALTRRTRRTYDGLNRLIRTAKDMNGNGFFTDAVDIVTVQTWDRSSRLTSQIDDRGNATRYQYDGLNRMTRTTFADGTSEQHAYDVHGNRVQSTDANGSVVTTTYDLNDRPTSRTIARAAGVLGTVSEFFQYDGVSRLIRAQDDDSVVDRRHDSLGHVVSETQRLLPGGPARTVTSEYDGEGNKVRTTYPGGRVVIRDYDSLERLKKVHDGGPLVAEYFYVGPERVQRIDRNNGTRTDYTYDGITGIPNLPGDAGVKQIIRTRHTVISSGAVIDDRSYLWDADHNKKSRRNGRSAVTHDYTYDAADRLIRTLVTPLAGPALRDERYDLDGTGNRLSVTGGPRPGTYAWNSGMPEPADSQMNQYTSTPMDSRTYDKNGNLTVSTPGSADLDANQVLDILDFLAFQNFFAQSNHLADFQRDGRFDIYDFISFQNTFALGLVGTGASGLSYDYRNQLVEYRSPSGGPVTRYAYDALGRRIEKVLNATTTPVPTRYYHDDKQEIEEQDGAGATAATYVYGRYIDEVLTMRRSGDHYHFHTDDQYNVMAATAVGGAVMERYDYGDYGSPEFYSPGGSPRAQSAIANPHLFTGRRFDPETGWYHYRTRYLDPKAGRFTTRDTIGIWGDAAALGNGLTYAGNNPWSGVDPEGTGWIKNAWNKAKSAVQSAVSSVTGAVKNAVGAIGSSGIGSGINRLWGGIKKVAGPYWGALKRGASQVWGGIKRGASNLWRGLKRGAQVVGNGIQRALNWIGTTSRKVGRAISFGFKWTLGLVEAPYRIFTRTLVWLLHHAITGMPLKIRHGKYCGKGDRTNGVFTQQGDDEVDECCRPHESGAKFRHFFWAPYGSGPWHANNALCECLKRANCKNDMKCIQFRSDAILAFCNRPWG